MSIKITIGVDIHGLRLAKKQARELIAEASGDRSDFARGIRSGLRALIVQNDDAIKKWRAEHSPPPPAGEAAP